MVDVQAPASEPASASAMVDTALDKASGKVLRSLASYRRRHAEILFGRYLTARSPVDSPGDRVPVKSADGRRLVRLKWLSEGDNATPGL